MWNVFARVIFYIHTKTNKKCANLIVVEVPRFVQEMVKYRIQFILYQNINI